MNQPPEHDRQIREPVNGLKTLGIQVDLAQVSFGASPAALARLLIDKEIVTQTEADTALKAEVIDRLQQVLQQARTAKAPKLVVPRLTANGQLRV